MKKMTLQQHIIELKNNILIVLCCFLLFFLIGLAFSSSLIEIIITPLAEIIGDRRMIYTELTEGFATHIRVAMFFGFVLSYPIFCWRLYKFVAPGLLAGESVYVKAILVASPILFYSGAIFLYYQVMPNAWAFFASYENHNLKLPLILEAKISDYLDLFVSLTTIFGVSFQLPIAIIILHTLKILSIQQLQDKRRFFIVLIFILAAILTPPDVLSQIALAIPLILLYEISILICKIIDKRGARNARHQMD